MVDAARIDPAPNKYSSREASTLQSSGSQQRNISGARRKQRELGMSKQTGASETDTSGDAATSAGSEGTAAHREATIENIRGILREHPEIAAEIGAPLAELENSHADLLRHESAVQNTGGDSGSPQQPAQHATDGASAQQSGVAGSGGNLGGAPIPGQIPGQTADPKDHLAHTQDRQNQMFQQQMAMQEANMSQQMMMSSFQQLSQTVTAFTQASNAETSALCNTMMDCVKAISELVKKGGAMQSAAIGN